MSDLTMKQHALAVFRKAPERLNCAQAVLYGYQKVSGDTALSVEAFKAFGGGRAPEGLCGALYAACAVAPQKAEELKKQFTLRIGSALCSCVREAKQHSCEECVAQASELLES